LIVTRAALLSFFIATLTLVVSQTPIQASRPSESLLPDTTKGYLSVPDVDLLREHWEKTQLGELAEDPLMKPFMEDFRKQFESKFAKTDVRLNIKIDDLKDVYGGEVAIAMIQPGGDSKQHARALLVDVTDHLKQANALLDKIDKNLREQKATRSDQKIGDVTLISYTLPKKAGAKETQRAFYFVRDDQLVATDHEDTAKEILSRFTGDPKDVLAEVSAFKSIMDRCQKAFGDTPVHIRWFLEPFGYVQTSRAASGGRKKRGTDMLKVLENQGFGGKTEKNGKVTEGAVRGVGGFVSLSMDDNEILHRTYIYAPPVNKAGEKYDLAARMLDFPNSQKLAPQNWVPREVTNYITFYWDMKKAFENSKSLVDEAAGAPVFDDVIDSLKNDPNGPRIDLRKDLIDQLGKRVSFFADYRLPITPTSERWLVALEVTNPAAVAKTLDRAMEADPDATKRVIGKHTVWEIERDEAPAEVEELEIDGPGFGEFDEEEEEEEGAPLLDHAAFTVTHGYLMVASHLDFIEEVLTKAGGQQTLAKAKDFTRVNDALKKLGAGINSFRFFTRTDKAYHTTYELIRQGKMPEAESMFGNLLNRMLGPEEEGVVREQQIEGEKLPEFEKIRKYLGPAGMFVESEEDGWLVTGCLLHKEEGQAKKAEAAEPKKEAAKAKDEAPKPKAKDEAPKPKAEDEAPKPKAEDEAPKPKPKDEAPKPKAKAKG